MNLAYFLGWCSPSGEFHRCQFGHHGLTAREILHGDDSNADTYECDDELKRRGWARIAGAPDMLETLLFTLPRGFNDRQYKTLRRLATEWQERGHHDSSAAFLTALDNAIAEAKP